MLALFVLLASQQPLTFDDFSGVYRAPPPVRSRIPTRATCGWQPGADIFQRTNWAAERDVLSLTMTGAELDADRLAFHYAGAFTHHHPVVPLRRVIGPGSMCVDHFDWFGCGEPTYTYAITGSVSAVRDRRTNTWGEVRHHLHFDVVTPPLVRHGTRGDFAVRSAGTGDPRLFEFFTRWNEAEGSNSSSDWPCIQPSDPAWRPPTPGIVSYYGVLSGAAPLSGRTAIRGQLVDEAQPMRTMTRARVLVYEQTAPLPLQGSATFTDYEATIRDRLQLVSAAGVDANGVFAVPNVPLFRFSGEASTGHWQANLVTLVVTSAEVDITGLSDAVPYGPRIVVNQPVFPDDGTAPTIGLVADIAFGEKRTLISRLSRISKNYRLPELMMATHLDTIEGAPTPAQREGVRRAVWAERALLEGATSMRAVTTRFARATGKLLADLWAEMQTFENAAVTRGLKERKRLSDARGMLLGNQSAQFDLANVQARVADQAYSRRLARASDAALASAAKDLFKLFAHLVKEAAVVAGVPRGIASSIADGIVLAMNLLFNAVATQTVGGATQDVVKKSIEFVAKVLVPVMFDNDTAPVSTPFGPAQLNVPFPFSYTNRTLDTVEYSVAQSTAWSVADDTQYIADVTRSATLINGITQDGVDAIQRSHAFEGANKTADIAETVFSIAKRIPGLQSLEAVSKGAKGAKYLATFADLVNLAVALLLTPASVEEAAYAAYGAVPPTSRGVGEAPDGSAANPNLAAAFDAAHTEARAAIAELDDRVARDLVGTAANGYLEDDGRYYRAMRALALAVAHLEAQTRAGTFSSDGPLATRSVTDLLRAADASTRMEDAANDALVAWLLGSMESTWTTLDDLAYRSAKNRVRARLAALDATLVKLDEAVQAMEAALASTLYLPAVYLDSLDVPTLTASPQTFVVRARLRNLGVAEAPAVRVGLTVLSDSDVRVEVLTSTTVFVGTLDADDGAAEGSDEATVEWTVRSTHPIDAVAPVLAVDVYEGSSTPTSFDADGRTARLRVDPSQLDADADGLPLSWEQQFGLDPQADDAELDRDSDGVVNRDELELGLDPSAADTDGDGLSDGEELSAGVDGFRTDPLEPDTDSDGTNDDADQSPLDPASIAAPPQPGGEPVLDLSTVDVTLTPERPVAVVEVINTGGGDLYFAAVSGDPTLLNVSPTAPGVAAPGTMVVLSLPLDRDVRDFLPLETTVLVADVAGATRDFMTIRVHLVDDDAAPPPDGGVASSDGGSSARDGGSDAPLRDAGVQAIRDGGPTTTRPMNGDGGCGCRAEKRGERSLTPFVALLLALVSCRRNARGERPR